MEYYAQTVDEVYRELGSSPNGLSGRDAEERIAKHGKNEIVQEKEVKPFTIFLLQFTDFIIWILIAAAIISILLGIYSGKIGTPHD